MNNPSVKYSKSDLEYRFSKYDTDGSGSISKSEFKEMYNQFSPIKLPDEVVENMLKKHDKDKSGSISFDEYCLIMNGQPFPKGA